MKFSGMFQACCEERSDASISRYHKRAYLAMSASGVALGAVAEVVAVDGAGEMDLLGHHLNLFRIDMEASGTAAVPAEERAPGHAAAAERAMYAALREEIALLINLFHFRTPLVAYAFTRIQRSHRSFLYGPFVIYIVQPYNSLKHMLGSVTRDAEKRCRAKRTPTANRSSRGRKANGFLPPGVGGMRWRPAAA